MLFTDVQPNTGRYTGAFNSMQYGKDVSNLGKFDKAAENGYKYGKPIGDAAIGILSAIAGPFGALIGAAYGAGSLGVNAMVKARRKQLAGKVANDARMNDMPAFGYGFDDNGIFYQTKQNVPNDQIGTGNYATDSGAGMEFGSALGKAFVPTTPTAPDITNYSPSNGSYPTFNYTPSAPTDYGTTINTTQSHGNMDWDNSWNGGGEQTTFSPPTTNMKKGGQIVVGGKGNDDIALVDTNTGGDTGVRVSKGEMLVVNKDRLNALKKAISGKNKKEVFNIIKAQIEEVPQDGKFAGGGRGVVNTIDFPSVGQKYIQSENPFYADANKDMYSIETNPNPGVVNTSQRIPPYANGFGAYQNFNGGTYYPDVSANVATGNTLYPNGEETIVTETGDAVSVPRGKRKQAANSENKFDWQNTLGNIAGHGYDIFRMTEGIGAANKKLPVFQKSAQWNDLLGRIRQNSFHGLTPEQAAAYNLDSDRTYATNVANIYNLSGGNAGLALSNLGTANMNRYGTNLKMAALDSELMNRNIDTYAKYLGQDIAYDRQLFDDKFGIALKKQLAGGQLMSDAVKNMKERNLTNQHYGVGSEQDKLSKMYLQRIQDENDILKANKEYYINNPDAFKPYSSSSGTYSPSDVSEEEITVGDKVYKLDKTKTKKKK